MGKPRIGDIEAAIINLIQTDDAIGSYILPAQVQSYENGVDFENLEITLGDFGVLVIYDGADYASKNVDQSGYDVVERWTLIAVAQNLRGLSAAKAGIVGERGVYDILEDLKSAIVKGRKLTVDTDKRVYLELLGTAVLENLFYRFGAAAIGLQIKAHCAAWEYAA